MSEIIKVLFSKDASASDKAAAFADLLNKLFAYVLTYLEVEAE